MLHEYYNSLNLREKKFFIEDIAKKCVVGHGTVRKWVLSRDKSFHRTPERLRQRIIARRLGMKISDLF